MEIPLFLLMTYSNMEAGGTVPHFLVYLHFCIISCLFTGAKNVGISPFQSSPSLASSVPQIKGVKTTALPHT